MDGAFALPPFPFLVPLPLIRSRRSIPAVAPRMCTNNPDRRAMLLGAAQKSQRGGFAISENGVEPVAVSVLYSFMYITFAVIAPPI